MDPKRVRKTLDDLCNELDRRARSGPWPFLQRQGRQLGLGLVLGAGTVAGCGSNAVPPAMDAYGVADHPGASRLDARDTLPNPDSPVTPDTRDSLPSAQDAYDLARFDSSYPDLYGVASIDARDAFSYADAYDLARFDSSYPDLYGVASIDTRDAVPFPRDAYGISDIPVNLDARDGAPDVPPPDTHDLDGEGDG